MVIGVRSVPELGDRDDIANLAGSSQQSSPDKNRPNRIQDEARKATDIKTCMKIDVTSHCVWPVRQDC
jgi:hypothetical protein